MPKVSVCCSVLNQSEWLMDMVGSVYLQTYQDWELIVVDDGSTEDIKKVLDTFKDERIKYVRFDINKGIPFGINHAFSLATGEYFSPLAADELLTKDKLETQVAFMDANPEIDCIWGLPGQGLTGPRPIWEQNALRAHNRSNKAWVRTLLNLEQVPIGGASLLMRRKVLDSIGYMDEKLTGFSDHEWFIRFFQKHKGIVLPYRWALSRPNPNAASVGSSPEKINELRKQLEYVRSKHQIELPPVTGKVTIGIPLYNLGEFVIDAIKSAQAQTYQDLEILILDDKSTDNSLEVVRGYLLENPDPRVKLMAFDENRGVHNALSQMAYRAEGVFFAPLAADDLIEPTFVERCLAWFEQNPWLELVASQTDFIKTDGSPIDEINPSTKVKEAVLNIEKAHNQTREEWLARLYYGNVYFGVGLYRTMAISDVGGWKQKYNVIGDYELYLALLQRENIHIIEENLTHTRIHSKNRSVVMHNKGAPPEWAVKLPQTYVEARRDYYIPRQKVMIATPFYEARGFAPYISCLAQTIRLLDMFNIDWTFLEHSGDAYVHRARNTICAKFMEDPLCTDLFFIDSDMSWDPDAFINILKLPHLIIGGAYPMKNHWDSWTSHPMIKKEGDKFHLVGQPLSDGSALLEANDLSAGFLRIKRRALEMFQEKYPERTYSDKGSDAPDSERVYIEYFETRRFEGRLWGEDMYFCKLLRDAGIPMHIYPNINFGHFGINGWQGNYHNYLKAEEAKQKQDQTPIAAMPEVMPAVLDIAPPMKPNGEARV